MIAAQCTASRKCSPGGATRESNHENGSSGKSGPSLLMNDTEWSWFIQLTSALLVVNLKVKFGLHA